MLIAQLVGQSFKFLACNFGTNILQDVARVANFVLNHSAQLVIRS